MAPGTSGRPWPPSRNAKPWSLEAPSCAKRRETSSCPSPSTLIANQPLSRTPRLASERWSMHTSTSGGSRLTELKALTVRPRGWPAASRVVTTVTPLANWPSARRNAEASTLTAVSSMPGLPLQLDLRGQQPQPQRHARGHERLEQHERHELGLVADHHQPGVDEPEEGEQHAAQGGDHDVLTGGRREAPGAEDEARERSEHDRE